MLGICKHINGYMRTPKVVVLHDLIDYFNSKYATGLPKKGLDTSHTPSVIIIMLGCLDLQTRTETLTLVLLSEKQDPYVYNSIIVWS